MRGVSNKHCLLTFFICICFTRECSGSVVECLSQDGRVEGLSLTGATALCPGARHINSCLVLVQPRKTRHDITEKLLTGT